MRPTQTRTFPVVRPNSVGEPPAFATDDRNRIVYWNRGAEQLLGVRQDEALGRVASAVLAKEELATAVRMMLPGVNVYLLLPAARAARRTAPPAPAPLCPLSSRERQILDLVSNGFASINIAARLNLSQATVRNHIQNILRKLDVHGQVEAVAISLRRGWIGSPAPARAKVTPLWPAPLHLVSAAV